jgi:HK97 gp10 family phage protein
MEIKLDLHFKEVTEKMREAVNLTVRDVVVDIAQDAIIGSPAKTGNNRRSIAYKVEGMGQGKHLEDRGNNDDYAAASQVESEVGELKFNEGAVYPTSGYGGFLETGTVKMEARPYLRPAMEKNFTELKVGQLYKEHLGE